MLLLTGIVAAQPGVSTATHQLTAADWRSVDQSISRAVTWIASSQQPDGSFPSDPHGQPGVTSLGVLAMLAQGDLPNRGEHGLALARAIDFVLEEQKPNGLLASQGPSGAEVSYNVSHLVGQTSVYNHAISGLMLAEAYAMTSSNRSQAMQRAIEKALKVTLEDQARKKRREVDHGGWRYLDRYSTQDSDLSVIGWQLMFLRSAKNAGFDVPAASIDDAVACIRRHFDQRRKKFVYVIGHSEGSRAMTGEGILALAHAGLHDTPEAKAAGDTMLDFSFTRYNVTSVGSLDRYHYSLFQCTHAAFQFGDAYWKRFAPPVYRTLLANQTDEGSWPPERTSHTDAKFGSVYTTALVVLSLSVPNQLLPIYQR